MYITQYYATDRIITINDITYLSSSMIYLNLQSSHLRFKAAHLDMCPGIVVELHYLIIYLVPVSGTSVSIVASQG